jgi:membrane protease YdiL (CAAX protease family)
VTAPQAPLAVRLVRSAIARLVIGIAAMVGLYAGVHAATVGIVTAVAPLHHAYFAVFTPLAVPSAIGVYVGLVRVLERRRASELSRSGALRELGAGLLVGACLFMASIGGIAALGGYSIAGTTSPSVMLVPFAMGIGSAVVEEIATRGIVFRLLEELLGTWAALALSSALFGLAHIANPHATVWSAFAIAVEAGTTLAAAYVVTRRLWLPIGIHAAWNFTQGGVFGVAVSGAEMRGFFEGEMHGPAWLTGGEFGAEASAVALVVCATAAALLTDRAVKLGRVQPSPWRRVRRSAEAAGAARVV